MTNLLLLAVCLIVGVLLQKVKGLPPNTHLSLNVIILHLPLPAVALLVIPTIDWDLSLVSLCLMPWFLFGITFFLFRFIGKKLSWDSKVIGCLILTGGLGNTAFVGFPVIEALFGKDGLKYALLIDQPGSFLILSTLGVWVASVYSTGRIPKRVLAKRVFFFPPFISFAFAILLGAFDIEVSGEVKSVLERIAGTLTPLALVSVGLQIKLKEIRGEAKFLFAGLVHKLVLTPVIIYFGFRFLGLPEIAYNVALMESAMPTMITASLLAASHNLSPRLAGLMVGIGVPLSFITLVIWKFLI